MGRRRAQAPTTLQEINPIILAAITLIALFAILWAVLSEVVFLATLAHFLEARVVSNAVAAAITVVSSAPQSGLYCVSLPAGFSYDVAIGTLATDARTGPILRNVPELSYCAVSEPGFSGYDALERFLAEANGAPRTLEYFVTAARDEGVPLQYLLAIAYYESGLRHFADDGSVLASATGYLGIMQVKGEGAESLEANIRLGARELRARLYHFGGDFQAAVAGYSSGEYGAELIIAELGGRDYWVENLGHAEFIDPDKLLPETNAQLAAAIGNWRDEEGNDLGVRYTSETQSACSVARATAAARKFESIGLGEVRYGFVAVLKEDALGLTGATFYMPLADIEPQVFRIPDRGAHTLVFKKALVPAAAPGYFRERIIARMREGGLAAAGCTEDVPSICLF